MSTLKLPILLLLALFLPESNFAQGKPQWVEEVERVFQQKEPKWKVERRHVHDQEYTYKQDITFRAGSEQVAVSISIWKRLKDAQDVFEAENLGLSNNPGNRRVKSKLPGFGDEGYIWVHRGSDAWPTVRFRKGSVIVDVFAPSVAVAKRFARHVVEQIPAS
jgi:hypothetical protein